MNHRTTTNRMITSIKKIIEDRKIRVFIFLAIMMILSLGIYRSCLSDLIGSVLHREGSSHGIFVPFISLFILWKRREEIKKLKPEFALLRGFIIVLLSLSILFIAEGNTKPMLYAVSFFIMMSGVVIALFGKSIMGVVSFPLFFLITMIPLPTPVYAQISEWMRSTSTAGSTWIAKLCCVPLCREGYLIHLPDINLSVNKSCSGIRYLISYLVFGLAYAFVYKKNLRSRILVIIATIPISVIAGMIRLATIFISAYYIGSFMAGHHIHILLSWFVFLTILVAFVLIDRRVSTS